MDSLCQHNSDENGIGIAKYPNINYLHHLFTLDYTAQFFPYQKLNYMGGCIWDHNFNNCQCK